MLVLSRKVGESIVIDGGITVRVIEVQGNRVRIALDAPKSVRIARGELTDAQLVDACRPQAQDRRTPATSRCVT
jgi:carbon storage regulator